MRRISFISILIALGIFAIFPTAIYAAATLTAPNGGECIKGGSSYNITWTLTSDHVAISHKTDGSTPGTWQADSGSYFFHPTSSGATSYSWTVPSQTVSTSRIWLDAHTTGHSSEGLDPSDANFSIDDSAPTASTASNSSKTDSIIDISWTASSDAGCKGLTGYRILRDSVQIASVSATTTYTDSGLSASTTYSYVIRAYDDFHTTDSNTLQVTTDSASDTTAPADVTDLAAANPTTSSIDLAWTAPGDDGSTGTAASYDIRYSTATITDGNWSSATQVSGEPTPQVAGSSESMTISGLSAGTTYYFAIKTSDEVPNESGLSNVANLNTASPPPSGGGGGSAPSSPSLTPATTPSTSTGNVAATASLGGDTTVTTSDSNTAKVTVPPSAISVDTTFTVTSTAKTATSVAVQIAAVPAGQQIVGDSVYNYTAMAAGSAVTSFAADLTLTFTYTDAQVAGLDLTSLKVHKYDEATGTWIALVTTVDTAAKTVTAITNSFSYFAIFGSAEAEEEPVTMTPEATSMEPSPSAVELVNVEGSAIVDGDLITTATSFDIYIVKLIRGKKFKRLILNPAIFNSYGHLDWGNVKTVSQEVQDAYTLAELVIEVNPDGSVFDPKVYKVSSVLDSDVGQRQWINLTAEEFVAQGYDWDAIYHINHIEAGPDFYPESTSITA